MGVRRIRRGSKEGWSRKYRTSKEPWGLDLETKAGADKGKEAVGPGQAEGTHREQFSVTLQLFGNLCAYLRHQT